MNSIGTGSRRSIELTSGEIFIADPEKAYFIGSGLVSVWAVDLDGAEGVTQFVGSRQFLHVARSDVYFFKCEAIYRRVVEEIPIAEVYRNPELLKSFLDQEFKTSQLLRSWMACQQRPSVEDRLWGVLHLLSYEFGRRVPSGLLIEIPLTHRVLAAAIGSTRATVTRLINQLVKSKKLLLVGDRKERRYCLPADAPGW